MTTEPSVTILLSVHNAASTLQRCLQSIQAQTYKHLKIVAIDDGSTDASLSILKSASHAYAPGVFTVISNHQNQGLTKSLNQGLAKIQTDYTARLDADDWWAPAKLAKQMQFITHHPEYGLIGCNYINVASTNQKEVILPQTDKAIKQSIFKRNPFAHSAVVFRTGLVKKVGQYDPHIMYGQDYDLWFRLLPHTKFYNLPEILCYRSTGQGISVSKQKDQMLQCYKTQRQYIKMYHAPITNYLFTLEPLLVAYLPDWVKNIKRKVLV